MNIVFSSTCFTCSNLAPFVGGLVSSSILRMPWYTWQYPTVAMFQHVFFWNTNGYHMFIPGWWFGTLILWLSIFWECHNPNWLSYFFRGVDIPLTSHTCSDIFQFWTNTLISFQHWLLLTWYASEVSTKRVWNSHELTCTCACVVERGKPTSTESRRFGMMISLDYPIDYTHPKTYPLVN